ncbi:DNA replication initiation factor cdc45, partial [Coemansia sp. RSA 2610]
IVPVSNYTEIASMNQTLVVPNLQIRSIVFLNCGAQIDIQDFVTLREDLVVMVIDSHRPFNLYNVFWHEQVQCLDDGDVEKNMVELSQAFKDIEFGDSSSDEDADDSDASADELSGSDDEDGAGIGRKRGSSEMLGDLARPDQHQQRRRRKRKTDMDPETFLREQQRKAERRELRAEHQRMIQAYYAQGSYHGQSCAISALMLAEQLGHPPSLDTVWWAIVGATSQHMLQHIDADGYSNVVRRMRDLVRRVCPAGATTGTRVDSGGVMSRTNNAADSALGSSTLAASSSQALLDSQLGLPGQSDELPIRENVDPFNPYLEMVPEEEDEGFLRARAGVSNNGEAGLLTSSKNVEQTVAISESAELKFMLLRHWSLSNAMRFSPYVATCLATWSSKGRARLDLLVAKLGLSQAEARAPYLHLDPELKKQLYRKMREIGSDYNMSDSLYSGFVRDFGWRKSQVSASDMVLAVLALLQKDVWANELNMAHIKTSGFFAAYDALSQFSVLRMGIQGAQHLQQLVVGQGISMLERQAVKTLRVFRLAILGDLESTSSHIFGSPFALRQLALFLMQTLRERSKSAHARLPFIIAGPINNTESQDVDKLLVLGITPLDYPLIQPHINAPFNHSTYAGKSRNHFGLVFEQVAGEVGAEARQGFFDSSAMEIRRSDMSAFVDKLRRHL